MANLMEKAIKETFIRLLEEKPLNEITVKEIAKSCDINRNSFYYHYKDIPELIESMVKEDAETIIGKYPSVESMVQCFDAITEFASHRKRMIMHIYRSVNREVFEHQLLTVSEYFVTKYVDTALPDDKITKEDKKTIINYYKGVCFGLTLNWLDSGMDENYVKSTRKIFLLKKDFSSEFSEFINNQK